MKLGSLLPLLAVPYAIGIGAPLSYAQDTAPAPSKQSRPESTPELKASPDTRTGTLYLGVAPAVFVPFGGDYQQGANPYDVLGAMGGLRAQLGYAISRDGIIGLNGEFGTTVGSSSEGQSTIQGSGSTFAIGVHYRYALTTGLKFDPWFSYGIAYRGVDSDTTFGPMTRSGIDWLRIECGSEWYPVGVFGISPVVGMTFGTLFADGSQSGTFIGTANFSLKFQLNLPGRSY